MSIKTASVRRFRRLLARPLRRFSRNENGTTAIEFGAVALPFIAFMFAIIESGMVFFSGQVLETAVADSARLILTGQAQSGTLDQTTFKKAICDKILALIDCNNNVYIDVRKFNSFGGISFDPLIDKDGKLINNFVYQPGNASEIVVVRLVYEFPVFVQLWNPKLVSMAGNKRLIVATAAFRNEPF
jgi:Flp pilus assembly protein TadG